MSINVVTPPDTAACVVSIDRSGERRGNEECERERQKRTYDSSSSETFPLCTTWFVEMHMTVYELHDPIFESALKRERRERRKETKEGSRV